LALDTGEVFIGAPNFALSRDRANYPFANIAVLTEFSQNLQQYIQYQYLFRNANGVPRAFTILNGTTITRYLQEKLDETVSVKSYGAKGDGMTDDTDAINIAILDTATSFNSTPNDSYIRGLYFPAGVYIISGPIFFPAGTMIFGDGPGRTIILCTNAQAMSVFETIADTISASQYEDPATRAIDLPLARGLNIQAANAPNNIMVANMSFQHQYNRDVGRFLRASDVFFLNCELAGSWPCERTYSNPDYYNDNNPLSPPDLNDSMSVLIDGLDHGGGAFISQNFTFQNCTFHHNTFTSRYTDNMRNINFDNCSFEHNWWGFVVGGGSDIPVGQQGILTFGTLQPTRISITNSQFNVIAMEGVDIKPDTMLCTVENCTFVSVGDGINSDCTPGFFAVAACVNFETGSGPNTFIGGTFETRTGTVTGPTNARVLYNVNDTNMVLEAQDAAFLPQGIIFQGGANLGLTGANYMQSNISSLSSFVSVQDQTSPDPLTFTVATLPNPLSQNNIQIQYSMTINNGAQIRTGTLTIGTNGLNIAGSVAYSDQFVETTSTAGIAFTPVIQGNTLNLQYVNPSSNGIIFRYIANTLPL